MNKLFLIGCAVLATAVSAHADFRAPAPQTFDGGAFECSVVKQEPQDKHDRNPVYKTNINVVLNDNGKPTSIGVIHSLRDGTTRDRSEQYSDGKIWQAPGRMEWYWSGRRGELQMTGVIYHNDRDGWMYQETQTKHNRLEYRVLEDCHAVSDYGDGDDTAGENNSIDRKLNEAERRR
jgi:hypothetical protein